MDDISYSQEEPPVEKSKHLVLIICIILLNQDGSLLNFINLQITHVP